MTPNLGVTQIHGESESPAQRLVLADLPGLIEGAHQVCVIVLLEVIHKCVNSVNTITSASTLRIILLILALKGNVAISPENAQCNVTHQATMACPSEGLQLQQLKE